MGRLAITLLAGTLLAGGAHASSITTLQAMQSPSATAATATQATFVAISPSMLVMQGTADPVSGETVAAIGAADRDAPRGNTRATMVIRGGLAGTAFAEKAASTSTAERTASAEAPAATPRTPQATPATSPVGSLR